MGRTTGPRLSMAVLVLALLSAAALVVGCGSGEIRDRYEAEKMAWQAGKLARAMSTNPELATDEMRARVEEGYAAIVRRFRPPTPGETLTRQASDIASISGQSRLALAALALDRDDPGKALELYRSVRDSYSFDRALSIDAYLGAGNALEIADQWPEAVRTYEELLADWRPAPSQAEAPDLRILRTPVRVALGYTARRDAAHASEWYERAYAYYDRWISDWDGSPTAALALDMKGEAYVQQGRFREAADAYELLDERYGTEDNRGALWLRLAEIYASGLGRPAKARDYYLMVTQAYAGEVAGATAEIAIARLNIEDGEYAAARIRLEKTLEDFKDEKAIAATALQYLALSHELEGAWESALPRYNALAQEHPTTLYGLAAPLHVARHYRDAGAAEAADKALARAVEHYERVIHDYASSPAELAARSHLVEALLDQHEWGKAADKLVETAGLFAGSEAAPGMLLQAAELYRGKLGDTAKATRTLETVRATYAGTPAAKAADDRLRSMTE